MLSKINNKKFMNLALSLASDRIGLTGLNPSVGCVIVKNGKIISIGQTGLGGIPHAEADAINRCKETLRGSHMYVSLEPCSHYGKTPPCTKKIIKSKIKKVYYGINDIDPRSSGKSENILKKKKIKVFKNFMQKNAKLVYKSYFHNKLSKFPYITGKLASTKNFLINSKKKYITNNHSLNISHLLRYRNQGILVSSKTINNDNPILNCRLKGLEKFSPERFILDRKLKIKINSKIVNSSNKYKTVIFYNKSNNKLKKLKDKGIKLVYCPLNKDNRLDVKIVLSKIKSFGVNYLLIEGGKELTNSFFKKNLFNEFYLFKSSNNEIYNSSLIKYSNIERKLKLSFKKMNYIQSFTANDKIKRFF